MKSKRPHDYEESVARFRAAIELQGDNPAAHAALAQIHQRSDEMELAIHHWRMAISGSPHGPLVAGWKSQLKSALEVQERRSRGLDGDGFFEFKVCHRCHADIPTKARKCERCGNAVEMTFFEWLRQRENISDIVRTAVPFVLVMAAVVIVVVRLPLEYKACLAMATVIVGAWYFLRGLGGTIID